LLGAVILPTLGLTFTRFRRVLLEDAIVVGEVADPVFCCLARIIFSLLVLALIIGAFLARTLGLVALIGFLPTIYKRIFRVTVVGAIPALEPISPSSLTLLGVALHLYLDALSVGLGCLSLLSSISD
jgi:hypothetical protein